MSSVLGGNCFAIILVLIATIEQALTQVGVVYSPFVRDGDSPNTNTYSREDVKVMLNLVKEKGYREITTYGVGVNSEQYLTKKQWNDSTSSIVHTAAVAAEINSETGSLLLIIYQGLFLDPEKPQTVEIEVGFDVASLANRIYPKTVKGVVCPSFTTLNNLPNMKALISAASSKAKANSLLFGTRVTDCSTLPNFRNNQDIRDILNKMNFVICQILPNRNHMTHGPAKFFELSVIRDFKTANEIISQISNYNHSIQIIMETGWPGGDGLSESYTNISSMLKYWSLVEKWSKEHKQQVFMHEAFDNPWKSEFSHISYAHYYGRWKASPHSRNEYELKVSKEGAGSSVLSKELIFGVVFGLLLFITLAVLILIMYRRVKKHVSVQNKLTEEDIRQFLEGIVTKMNVDEGSEENLWDKMPYNQGFELPKHKFSIDKTVLLGSGTFGSVYKGKIDGLLNEVAFKTTRPDCPVSALRGLLSEIKILIFLGKHENIVSICGAYTSEIANGTIYVATELCSKGSLEKFLRNNRTNYKPQTEIRYVDQPSNADLGIITDLMLLRWASQIASAMEYISYKKVIHADLAARNVLLSSDLTAKVTDFGLSRRLYEYTEYVKKQQEPLPWRWMAIESLARLQFSTSSDVWAFAITLYEIFSLGDVPYPGLNWTVDFVSQLENGLRVPKPFRASDRIYEIMSSCWNLEPASRPSFSNLKDALVAISTQL